VNISRKPADNYEDYFDIESMEDALRLMGFAYLEMNFYRREDPESDLVIYGEMYDDAIIVDVYDKGQKTDSITTSSATEFIDFVEKVLKEHNIDNVKIVESEELDLVDDGIAPRRVLAKTFSVRAARQQKTSTRDFADKLSRVKSSNVWAYAFNPKDEYIGDMLMQFKNKNGGPADIYIYYDVPSKIWRRLVAAPSKGHAFWELIRNRYKYAKLTGDKRTKLPNGI
jgi:hypothetical protein